jgi:putative CocE/NonD family hydrolase
MSLLTRFIGKSWKLPPVETRAIAVEKDLAVPMSDGVLLRADHYAPLGLGPRPTLLMRSPYGRGFPGLIARLAAERGFHALVQACRGTGGSEGAFDPFRNEGADGRATLEWLRAQPWYNGELATLGASYLGYNAWALARSAGDQLKAMVSQITSSEMGSTYRSDDVLALELGLRVVQRLTWMRAPLAVKLSGLASAERQFRVASRHLPLREADRLAAGQPASYWQDWLEHQPGDAWWAAADYSGDVGHISAPNHHISGWYDIMLPQLLRDYRAQVEAGQRPYLTIGPWDHQHNVLQVQGMREGLIWLRAQLLGDRTGLHEAPVRVFVVGADEWRDLPAWPPANISPQRWHLQPSAALAAESPPASPPDAYRYDPRDPTPSVGGPIYNNSRVAGRKDNRALEARPDVLCYTSAPLEQPLELMGNVQVELFVRSSLPHSDFVVRLCDVDGAGASLNICDALRRVRPGQPEAQPDGSLRLTFELWAIAYRIARGHRLRVQVSSGAFPRWARNLGSGEPDASATTILVADQQVFHDPEHPSAVLLPVV